MDLTLVEAVIEYRMQAVGIGRVALLHKMQWTAPPKMEVYFDGKQVFEGQATGLTNGAIEAAIIHCRALLEFAGLKGATSSKLEAMKGLRQADDHGIERFASLSRVTVDQAVSAYGGARDEAEAALARVIHLANKGLAHTTSSFTKQDDNARLLEIAFRGVPTLIANRFYVARGVEAPNWEPSWREHGEPLP